MKNIIKMLKLTLKCVYKTVGCCCGHGKYPMTILIECNGTVIEIFSGNVIPRKRRFYKRDKQGYYYIPETNQNENRNP